jgi:EAL domain-containing protein (putative c-di-GMP-specific phosphodiesterase class I)
MLIDSLDDVIEKLKQLRALGIQVALDDFGTGFASLSYLKNLPVDLLKIDKAFIDHITDGEEDKDFVDAIISMGHILHFTVISEGVEVNEQLEALKDLGCDLIQGYIWGKPLDTDKALEVVKAG